MAEAGFVSGVSRLNYLGMSLAAAVATAIAIMAAKGFVGFASDHPVISILLLLASVPVFFPFRKVTMPYAKAFFRKYAVVIVAAVLLTVGILSLSKYFVLAFLLLLHILMSIFLRVLKKNHIGVEIVMLITVLSGAAYGPKAGALMGAVSMVIDYVFSGRFSYFCIVTIPTYAAIGALAGSGIFELIWLSTQSCSARLRRRCFRLWRRH
ncbi:hypothetical protein HYU15_01960 [Candidatus Woesearchaeota archaeon]|nr:hypothetical protein [Candidatus Woesearchaeota archaeon]